ncbi:hypothetical protein [Desertibacillus haloalkaliphilus]|nr:hypothetical protein [Desertibacillus haloalkaliphilus]MBU8908008.1 hypothetical protein [Desertibacillus haloalkaliphilus]
MGKHKRLVMYAHLCSKLGIINEDEKQSLLNNVTNEIVDKSRKSGDRPRT